MSAKLTICRGLPCSGKSTWAIAQQKKHDGIVRVNRDILRDMLHANDFNHPNEQLTNHIRDHIIKEALKRGRWVICDDTNLRPRVVRNLKKLAGPNIPVEEVVFEIEWEVAWQRELDRRLADPGHVNVPEIIIRKMADDWAQWKHVDTTPDWHEEKVDQVVVDPTLPWAVMCDLDGTLAHFTDRGPYDHMRCSTDDVDERVSNVLDLYAAQGFTIILMSGRDGESRELTEKWLLDHKITYNELYMRTSGDQRKDSKIKRELFDEHVRGHYNIHVVLDDRNQVVDTWRDMGLVVWQVAPGDF